MVVEYLTLSCLPLSVFNQKNFDYYIESADQLCNISSD